MGSEGCGDGLLDCQACLVVEDLLRPKGVSLAIRGRSSRLCLLSSQCLLSRLWLLGTLFGLRPEPIECCHAPRQVVPDGGRRHVDGYPADAVLPHVITDSE